MLPPSLDAHGSRREVIRRQLFAPGASLKSFVAIAAIVIAVKGRAYANILAKLFRPVKRVLGGTL